MTIEEAIKTALEYETKVEQTYRDAAKASTDEAGKRVFTTLADEERGHIDYLNSRMSEWQKTGHVTIETLVTVVPPQDRINEGVGRLEKSVTTKGNMGSVELEWLQRALSLEQETGAFYKRVVSELSDEGQQLFQRFVEIEEGHAAIVQAEIDAVGGMGFWFDVQEWRFTDG